MARSRSVETRLGAACANDVAARACTAAPADSAGFACDATHVAGAPVGAAARRVRHVLLRRGASAGRRSAPAYGLRPAHFGEPRERQPAGGLREQRAAAANRCAPRRSVSKRVMATAECEILTCAPAVKPGLSINFSQGQHRKPDGPQAEAADAGLVAGNEQRVIQRVAQMRVRHADQFAHAGIEARDPALPGQAAPDRRRGGVKTSCGSQQAPRLRSSQTSFRILVICRPCANETARRCSSARLRRDRRRSTRKTAP